MFFNGNHKLDLPRIQRRLEQAGRCVRSVISFGHGEWAVHIVRAEKGPVPFPRWKEEMTRDYYTCDECRRHVTLEYPQRRGKPVLPLPTGWVRVGKRTFCGYCASEFGSVESQDRQDALS